MNALQLLLRLVHIVAGGLWVGMMALNVFFLMPALGEVGPDAGRIMAALQRRRLMTVLPFLALATIISGLWLYWRASGGFALVYLTSGMGAALGIGGVLSIIAYALGITMVRPAMLRMAGLTQQMAAAQSDQERQALGAQVQQLRARSTTVSRATAWLLLLAIALMAVARYV
jgi:hypothetical protein